MNIVNICGKNVPAAASNAAGLGDAVEPHAVAKRAGAVRLTPESSFPVPALNAVTIPPGPATQSTKVPDPTAVGSEATWPHLLGSHTR